MRTIIFCLLLSFSAFAQPGNLAWEKTFGGNGDESMQAIIEATNGNLVAVGVTASQTQGATDAYLLITDFSTGNERLKRNFGGRKADGFNAVVQSFDGHFLLGGYTESKGNGKADAWLVLVDERGQLIWERTMGTAGDDRILAMDILPGGEIVVAGYSNDQRSGDIWIALLDAKNYQAKPLWEKSIGRKQFASLSALAISSDGNIVLTGNTQQSDKRRKGDIWLAKISNKGQLQWEQYFGEKDWEEASEIICTRDGGIALAGLTTSKGAGEMDMWLIKTRSDGSQQWEQTFGGKDADLAYSLAEDPNGDLILAGASKSHRSGARQNKGYLVRTNSGGVREWEYHYGGNKEDLIQDVIVLHNGSLLALGETASKGEGGNDAWLINWSGDLPNAGNLAGAKQSGVEHSQARINTVDGQLKPGDKTYLSFNVSNTTGVAIDNLQVQLQDKTGAAGLQFWTANYLGQLAAGESKVVRIPVAAANDLASGEAQLGVNLLSGNQQIGSFNTTIKTKQPLAAALEFGQYNFAESRTSDEEHLSVLIQNPGDYVATPVSARFELPNGLEASSPLSINLGSIPPHGSKKVDFKFRRNASFRGEAMNIVCIVQMGNQQIRKTLTRAKSLGRDVVMILTQPNETKSDLQNIVSGSNVFNVQVAVGAPNPLQQQNFKIYNFNQALDGSKMDEVQLSRGKQESGRNTYVYNSRVHLQPGENRIEVEVATPEGNFRTKTIVVHYQPRQPNLHVLAIGPAHEDLNFTAKDAEDFANAFTNQGGAKKLFGKVFIRKLTTAEETKADGIRESLSDLVFQFENETASQRIFNNDVLIVFISSHGKNARGGFMLLPSNYDPRYERTRTIDFQEDVVNELEQINCKKLVFIDACHSGSADSKALSDIGRADALTKLAAMHPGMSILTSCRSNELSYEDSKWQNGAFTEALLEAFSDVPAKDKDGAFKSDTNNNGIISLAELYDYLRRRVPGMVKAQKANAPTNQTPFLPENQLKKEDMSIFVVE